MTSNVLSARWGELLPEEESINALPIAERSEIYAAILAKYQPDAIGLQEACEVWGEKLPAYLQVLKDEYGIEYTWLHHTYNYLDHDYMSMTSILYRSDKFDVVEKGYKPVSYWIEEWESLRHDYFIRSFAWAQLRMKSNPQKEFIVLNTHWELNERLEKVQKCLQEHAALVNQLYTQYDVPVICTGDFNSKNKSEDYYTFLDASGLHDMMYEAEDNNGRINLAGGNGEMGKVRPNSGNYIDHIYGTSECTGLRFETIVSDMSHFMTDHSAMVADIKLN